MNNAIEDRFEFWCPIQKSENSVDESGNPVMLLGGIASTSDEDSDGEFLDPKGFDIKPLLTSGLVNWHHQAKEHPDTIIGEPTVAEIRPEGLYIETTLYPNSKVACDVWELAQTLEANSKTRRLGYSIEGKVIKRKSNDKNNPDYKHIEKAIITGVAITHMPKNPKTFANVIKGDIENDFENEVEEEMQVEATFSKAEVMEKLFIDIPGISIEKAEQIYTLIKKYSTMAKKKMVTQDDIAKAYEALGFSAEEVDIQKGENGSEETAEEEETEEEEEEKKTSPKPNEESGNDEEEEEVEEAKKGEESDTFAENRFDRIEKAIATTQASTSQFVRALGVMIKDVSQKLDVSAAREAELYDIIKAQDETISALSTRIEEFGDSVPAPKSLSNARAVERVFGKADDADITKGGAPAVNPKAISMSKNSRTVAELLDQATFAKGGYDEEFSKACTSFEASHTLPATVIARMKKEFGVEIVD